MPKPERAQGKWPDPKFRLKYLSLEDYNKAFLQASSLPCKESILIRNNPAWLQTPGIWIWSDGKKFKLSNMSKTHLITSTNFLADCIAGQRRFKPDASHVAYMQAKRSELNNEHQCRSGTS